MSFEIALRCDRCGVDQFIDGLPEGDTISRDDWHRMLDEASDWEKLPEGWVCPDCLAAERHEKDIRETDERDYAAYAAGIVRDIQKIG